MKILNLFAGIGGNRLKWDSIGGGHEITAVESEAEIAAIYKTHYPNDQLIQADVYSWIADHIDDGWEFIWASPPCKTHSRLNVTGQNIRLPDLRLYELIIFFQHFAKCKWVVENVMPYYKPLIPPTVKLDRHFFWSNFAIQPKIFQSKSNFKDLPLPELAQYLGMTVCKREYLRNCCNPEIGSYILNQAIKQKPLVIQ